jgi:hypothetical protein
VIATAILFAYPAAVFVEVLKQDRPNIKTSRALLSTASWVNETDKS